MQLLYRYICVSMALGYENAQKLILNGTSISTILHFTAGTNMPGIHTGFWGGGGVVKSQNHLAI